MSALLKHYNYYRCQVVYKPIRKLIFSACTASDSVFTIRNSILTFFTLQVITKQSVILPRSGWEFRCLSILFHIIIVCFQGLKGQWTKLHCHNVKTSHLAWCEQILDSATTAVFKKNLQLSLKRKFIFAGKGPFSNRKS
mgnify:CR=1 FL=1